MTHPLVRLWLRNQMDAGGCIAKMESEIEVLRKALDTIYKVSDGEIHALAAAALDVGAEYSQVPSDE